MGNALLARSVAIVARRRSQRESGCSALEARMIAGRPAAVKVLPITIDATPTAAEEANRVRAGGCSYSHQAWRWSVGTRGEPGRSVRRRWILCADGSVSGEHEDLDCGERAADFYSLIGRRPNGLEPEVISATCSAKSPTTPSFVKSWCH